MCTQFSLCLCREGWSRLIYHRDAEEHGVFTEKNLLNRYQISQRPKASIANSTHDDQMFRTAKQAVLLAMVDDARGQAFTDAGQGFQFVR